MKELNPMELDQTINDKLKDFCSSGIKYYISVIKISVNNHSYPECSY